MTARGAAIGGLLIAALAAGTLSDIPRASIARTLGGYHVLAADFHVHSFPTAWSTLSPWDTVIEGRYQGLDVVALTPHDLVWPSKVGRWFAQRIGAPLVLVSEEIAAPQYHLIAVGIHDAIPPTAPLAAAIDEVHRQGGVAIAAHAYRPYWPSYDAAVMQKLDGAEIVRPEAQHDERLASELRAFYARAPLAAIGSTDYHGLGPIGYSRTYVFATSRTEAGVLDALRARRTVVYDRDRAYGDPAMIRLASEHGGLPRALPTVPAPGAARVFSRIAGVLALVAALFVNKS